MPSNEVPRRRYSIAIVGTGVAGLAAAWLLKERHAITVYEQDSRLGGHSNTVEVEGAEGPVPIDTGFIVYNELNYPNLTALFRHLAVPTKGSSMSFSVSLGGGRREYSGNGLQGLFAQPTNLVSRRHWRMLIDILRFYREGPRLLKDAAGSTLTLGEYLDREGYSEAFADDHLLPMAAAIWSTPAGNMRDHPAAAFIRFCVAHGLMRIRGRPQWRTVCGGSQAYVRRLSDGYRDRVWLRSGVRFVRRLADGVLVGDQHGRIVRYDRLVLATHADQALALLEDADASERATLGAFSYSRNIAVLHSDSGLMPKRRRIWSSWNYIATPTAEADRDHQDQIAVTYWMNRLQGIDPRRPLFVTLNPWREPCKGSSIASFTYDHPTYDARALAAQRGLSNLQGRRHTWFCGSYFGAGFHEDALVAGLAAAESAGSVRRPWADEASRGEGSTDGFVKIAAEQP